MGHTMGYGGIAMRSAGTTRIVVRMLVYGGLAAAGQILLALSGLIDAAPLWHDFWYTF